MRRTRAAECRAKSGASKYRRHRALCRSGTESGKPAKLALRLLHRFAFLETKNNSSGDARGKTRLGTRTLGLLSFGSPVKLLQKKTPLPPRPLALGDAR